MKEFNNNKMASLNQISAGLIAEAMVQLELSKGDDEMIQIHETAKANIKDTWQELLDEPQVPDRDAPLGEVNDLFIVKYGSPLLNPDSPVVACLTYIY